MSGFQVLAFLQAVMMNDALDLKTCLVLCPASTVLNWDNECKEWMKHVPKPLRLKVICDEILWCSQRFVWLGSRVQVRRCFSIVAWKLSAICSINRNYFLFNLKHPKMNDNPLGVQISSGNSQTIVPVLCICEYLVVITVDRSEIRLVRLAFHS